MKPILLITLFTGFIILMSLLTQFDSEAYLGERVWCEKSYSDFYIKNVPMKCLKYFINTKEQYEK